MVIYESDVTMRPSDLLMLQKKEVTLWKHEKGLFWHYLSSPG